MRSFSLVELELMLWFIRRVCFSITLYALYVQSGNSEIQEFVKDSIASQWIDKPKNCD